MGSSYGQDSGLNESPNLDVPDIFQAIILLADAMLRKNQQVPAHVAAIVQAYLHPGLDRADADSTHVLPAPKCRANKSCTGSHGVEAASAVPEASARPCFQPDPTNARNCSAPALCNDQQGTEAGAAPHGSAIPSRAPDPNHVTANGLQHMTAPHGCAVKTQAPGRPQGAYARAQCGVQPGTGERASLPPHKHGNGQEPAAAPAPGHDSQVSAEGGLEHTTQSRPKTQRAHGAAPPGSCAAVEAAIAPTWVAGSEPRCAGRRAGLPKTLSALSVALSAPAAAAAQEGMQAAGLASAKQQGPMQLLPPRPPAPCAMPTVARPAATTRPGPLRAGATVPAPVAHHASGPASAAAASTGAPLSVREMEGWWEEYRREHELMRQQALQRAGPPGTCPPWKVVAGFQI